MVAVDLGVADGVRSEWDYEKQRRTDTKTRIADVYVFCLLAEVDQQKFDPTDLDQWEFYLLRTNEINEINEQLGTQKTLSLNRLRSLNPTVCRFGEIGTAIMQRVAIDKG